MLRCRFHSVHTRKTLGNIKCVIELYILKIVWVGLSMCIIDVILINITHCIETELCIQIMYFVGYTYDRDTNQTHAFV